MTSHAIRKRSREGNTLSSIASNSLRGGIEILLESTNDRLLLRRRLVSTVTELGRGVDPLELDLLERPPAGVCEHGLAESDNPLLDTRDGTLEQKEVVLDLTVTDEATKTI